MLTVTFEQFLTFKPCWLGETGGKARLKEYFKNGALSALDILKFDDVSRGDRLWAVLREELIPAHIIHEFGCRCVERALSHVEEPNPCSLEVIRIKRLWMKGAATDEELEEARNATEFIIYKTPRNDRHTRVAYEAAWEAARYDARAAALNAVWVVVMDRDYKTERQWQWQVEELIRMLEEATNNNNKKKEGKPK